MTITRRGLGEITPRQKKQVGALIEELAQHLQTGRKRINIGQEQGLSNEFLSAMEIEYTGLLNRLDGLAREAELVDTARELTIWNDSAAVLEGKIEAFNQTLIQEVPGELSKRNWRIAGYVIGGTVFTASVLWVLWWVSKTWWVGRR